MNSKSNYIIFGVIIALALVYAFFFRTPSDSELDFGIDALCISGDGYSYTLDYDAIDRIGLVEAPDYGTEVSGGNSGSITYGTWENADWGTYTRATNDNVDSAITVFGTDGTVTVFNYQSDSDTGNMYTAFASLLNGNDSGAE